MAVCEVLTERYPLLMENSSGLNGQEHVINITKDNIASSSISHHDDDHHSGTDTMHYEDRPSTSTPHPISQTPTESDSRNVSFRRDEDNNDTRQPRRSPLNSGLWITIELLVNLSQIVAAIIVLSLSRHEKPHTPLFGWVVGYTMGCIATLPHLYWRYIHGNGEHANSHQNSLQNQENASRSSSVVSRLGPRFNAFADNFKMALDCFFAVWFVIGNVWIFSGHSSLEDSPNLYRLCIAFLTFNCIGYAMPFILCATICCCLPCIISILGYREDLGNTRGATTEAINALPTYKFRSKRKQNREQSENSSEGPLEGGIFAAGTSKERIVSAEDAVCCICLAQYLDNEELRELPCAHFFHTDCVDKWLAINALCPLCKSAVGKSSGPSTFFTTSSRHTGNGSNDRV